jgi:hypothetical protein
LSLFMSILLGSPAKDQIGRKLVSSDEFLVVGA